MACTPVKCSGAGDPEGKGSSCCHWRSVRFSLLFLFSVGAIVGVYQVRSVPAEDDETVAASSYSVRTNLTALNQNESRRGGAVFDINDVITHDRWVVLQPREGIEEKYACAVVEASVEQGWRPLVLAEELACCSKPRCVLLHSAKRSRLPYELRSFLERFNRTDMAEQRNLGFLFAIQHGARFLMDWYFEHPFSSDPRSVSEYQKRVSQMLHSVTLDVSLGLVLERATDAPLFAVSPRPTRRVYNPHAHFGRPDVWVNGFRPPQQRQAALGLMTSAPRGRLVPRWVTERPTRRRNAAAPVPVRQRYRVCELRPPSVEKFLRQPSQGLGMDVSAPAVVIPSDTLAPASAQTSLYSGEALWALALLSDPTSQSSLSVSSHLLRTLWSYPLLASIAASVRVALSPFPSASQSEINTINTTRLEDTSAALTSAVLRWRCNSRSILTCVTQLGRDLVPIIGQDAATFLAVWASDLKRLRYLEPPVVPLRRGGHPSPCLGHHGLGGIMFQALPVEPPQPLTREEVDRRTRARARYAEELELLNWIRQLDSSHNNDTNFSSDPSNVNATNEQADAPANTELPLIEDLPKIGSSKREQEHSSIQRETVDGMCLGFSDLLPTRPGRDFTTTLLIVSFSADGGYDLLPMIEVMYRPHFPNILYCGPPHSSLEIYTHKFQVAENRTLSYLPASASGFECLVGAMEMGYHVDDFLFVSSDSLILPWTIANLNRSEMWFGTEADYDDHITKTDWRDLDPGGQKIPRVIEAVGQSLKFVAHLLGIHEVEHYDHDDEEDIMTYEEHYHHTDEAKEKPKLPVPNEEVEANIPELHLHAEGVTDSGSENGTVFTYDTKETFDQPSTSSVLLPFTQSNDATQVPEFQEEITTLTNLEGTSEVDIDVKILQNNSEPKPQTSEDSLNPFREAVLENQDKFNKNISEPSETTNTNDQIFVASADVTTKSTLPSTMNVDGGASENLTEKGQINSEVPLPGNIEIYEVNQEPKMFEPSVDEASHNVFIPDVNAESDDSEKQINPTSLPTTSTDNITAEPRSEWKSASDDADPKLESPITYDTHNPPSNTEEAEFVVFQTDNTNQSSIPIYHIDQLSEAAKPLDDLNVTSFLQIDELTDASLNPVQDSLSRQVSEDIERNAENGFAKRKAEIEPHNPKNITKREIGVEDTQTPLSGYIDRRMERTFKYIEELFTAVTVRLNGTLESHVSHGLTYNRLEPREFKHLRCYESNVPAYHASTDLCSSLRKFYLQINELYHKEGAFTPPYSAYPIYHVPASKQKAFYLLANVFLQFGVPDQVAVPLLLRGLSSKLDLIHLKRTFFGSDAPATVQPGYPLFNEKSHFIFPVRLQKDLHGDSRFRSVFCLKYLYKMLS